MKCNGDCYPCEVFNLNENMFLGNYFDIGIEKISLEIEDVIRTSLGEGDGSGYGTWT